MVFIWRGWGFLTIPLIGVVIFAGLFAALWVTETLQLPDWAKIFEFAAILLLAGLLNWKLGRFLNRTGLPGARHDLFFIRMEYWSVPFFLFAVVLLASGLYAQ